MTDTTADWYWEGNVVDAIARYLAADGWTILSKADIHSAAGCRPSRTPRRSRPADRSQGLSFHELDTRKNRVGEPGKAMMA
ncbi:MAG: hypothetical protein WD942_06875, partial [Dehalococcoidia bacterium]